jgi:hypothetical protein
VNRVIAQRIVESINDALPTSIEYIPEAIGKRIKRRNDSIVDLPSELRRHERRPMLSSALAIRLTDRLQPFGSPFQVFVRDLSASGLGFVHTRHWPDCKIAIRLENLIQIESSLFVVGSIKRSFCKSGIYEVGIEFIHNFRADRLYVLPEAPIAEQDPPAPAEPALDADDAPAANPAEIQPTSTA